MNIRAISSVYFRHYTRLIVLIVSFNLVACVMSSEPRQLAPHINLSPEDVSLANDSGAKISGSGVDFGLQTSINESDSLSNISILPGVRVRTVRPAGPAALAGIRAGDVILAIDQTQTNHPDALVSLAQAPNNEQPYLFEVRRDTLVFEAALTALPVINTNSVPEELYRADPVATRAGYRTEIVSTNNQPDLTAAKVVRFFEESPLPDQGIELGDQIVFLDGRPVTSAQNLINALNNDHDLGDTVEMTLVRDNVLLKRNVKLWDPGRKINKLSFLPFWRYESTIDPDKTRFNVIDLWLFSFFSSTREGNEKEYSILGLIQFSSGLEGELADEND